MRYPLDEHRRAMGRWTKDPDACTCTPVNPRHRDPWHCIPADEIDAWRKVSGCGPQTARAQYWVWKTYGQRA